MMIETLAGSKGLVALFVYGRSKIYKRTLQLVLEDRERVILYKEYSKIINKRN